MKHFFSYFLFWFFLCFSFDSSSGDFPQVVEQAMNDGLTAAKQHDYGRALEHFRTAQRLSPESPDVLFNIALAEAKLPGRELRAAAWFGMFLAARPDAENRDEVRRRITSLQEANEARISRTIDLYNATIEQLPAESAPYYVPDVQVRRDALKTITASRKMANEWTGDPAPLAAAARGDFLAAYRALSDISDETGRKTLALQVCDIKEKLLKSEFQPGPPAWVCGNHHCQSVSDWMKIFGEAPRPDLSLEHPVFTDLAVHLADNPSPKPDVQVTRIREALAKMIEMTGLVDAMLRRQAAARSNAKMLAEEALHRYIQNHPRESAERDAECAKLNEALQIQIQQMLKQPLPAAPVAPRASGY